MKVYLAGGAVRDLLLGSPITDRDYLVMDATKEEFMETYPTATEVGRAFPVFLVNNLEFSFPRGTTVSEELNSRDLTVNAMLLDDQGRLLCHPQSLEDLCSKTLRPASRQSFIDDPLRVFRAARFWAKYPAFTPHPDLIETMRHIADAGLLNSISADRIGQETQKALLTPSPGNYLRLLAKAECLSPWLAEFKDCLNIPAGPQEHHDTNVIEHTCRVMDKLAGDETAVWMGLCHDIGKTLTPTDKLPSHHGHDKSGSPLALGLAKRIRLSNAFATAGERAAKWHMVAARYQELRPGTKVDLLMDLHLSRTFEPLFSLVQADHNISYIEQARHELETILSVSLAPEDMNKGAESGKKLRDLRAEKLACRTKK